MSLLTALIVKNSNILPGIYFIFLKNALYNKLGIFSISNLELNNKMVEVFIK